MIEFLTNPWVIIVIVLSVIIGNIALVKYTANMKFEPPSKKALDKLNELDQKRHAADPTESPSESPSKRDQPKP